MAAFKTESNGTWYIMLRYTDWKGKGDFLQEPKRWNGSVSFYNKYDLM